MPTVVYLLRHGQAQHNTDEFRANAEQARVDPKYLDSRLTEKGVYQAIHAQDKLKGIVFDAIYCSPLRRCRNTLLLAFPESATANVAVDDRILEQPYGHNIADKRMERADVVSDCPPNWICENVSESNPFHTSSEAVEREAIRSFTADVCRQWPGGVVFVVAHQTWIRRWTEMFHVTPLQLENCGIASIEIDST